ncbi:MAG: CPBP family intramembrane metalloprotease [Phycisphaerae bacterium]|nr:CPBP family intramembrane metalloprotease [Phycisphaerae bacterium]
MLAFSENEIIGVINILWYIAGISILIGWFKSGGNKNVGQTISHSLADEDMIAVVLGFLFASFAIAKISGENPGVNNYIGMIVVKIAFCIAALFFVGKRFKAGLVGFGFAGQKIIPTVLQTIKHLFVVLAVMNLVLTATVAIAEKFGFPIQEHAALDQLRNAGPDLKIAMVFAIVVFTPLFEEILFRGILQNYMISSVRRARQTLCSYNKDLGLFVENHVVDSWVGIIITSVLFAIVHADIQHWPALIVLSMGFGYCYQKNRNIWCPILMHALFNGSVVALNLLNVSAGN